MGQGGEEGKVAEVIFLVQKVGKVLKLPRRP